MALQVGWMGSTLQIIIPIQRSHFTHAESPGQARDPGPRWMDHLMACQWTEPEPEHAALEPGRQGTWIHGTGYWALGTCTSHVRTGGTQEGTTWAAGQGKHLGSSSLHLNSPLTRPDLSWQSRACASVDSRKTPIYVTPSLARAGWSGFLSLY